MLITAKEKLAEKDIDWHESYTDKTQFLKDQYTDIIGEGSYFRFEGKDQVSGAEYYCIISPGGIHKPRAKFFAGVRRLPAKFSAGGKYFDSMDAAAHYAEETWGVKTPKSLRPYTSRHLTGLSSKIKKWKDAKDKEEEIEKDPESGKIEKESNNLGMNMKLYSVIDDSDDFKIVEAMGSIRQENRDTYDWWDYDDLVNGGDDTWNDWLKTDPSLSAVIGNATAERRKKMSKISDRYGLSMAAVANVFKTYIGYHPMHGAYICCVGVYIGDDFEEAYDTFGYFTKRKSKTTSDQLYKSVKRNIAKYMKTNGVQLEPSDLSFVIKEEDPESDTPERVGMKEVGRIETLDPNHPATKTFIDSAPMVETTEFRLNNNGVKKVLSTKWGPLYTQVLHEIAAKRNITPEDIELEGSRDTNLLKAIYSAMQKKYENSVKSGEAALTGMTPPPKYWSNFIYTGSSGQQTFTTIPTNAAQGKKLLLKKEIIDIMKSGIKDIKNITQYLNLHAKRKGNDISEREVANYVNEINSEKPNATNEELEAESTSLSGQMVELASEKGFKDFVTAFKMAKMYFSSLQVDKATGAKLGVDVAPPLVFDPPQNFSNVTAAELTQLRLAKEEADRANQPENIEQATPSDIEQDIGTPVEQPLANLDQEKELNNTNEEDEEFNPNKVNDIYSNTIKNLIKISAELDSQRKYAAAEEVHKIIRKYQGKI